MRRMTSVNRERDTIEFALKAAEHFEKNPECATFGELEPETLLALRWGLGEDCVLIVRLDCEEGVIYQQIIKKREAFR